MYRGLGVTSICVGLLATGVSQECGSSCAAIKAVIAQGSSSFATLRSGPPTAEHDERFWKASIVLPGMDACYVVEAPGANHVSRTRFTCRSNPTSDSAAAALEHFDGVESSIVAAVPRTWIRWEDAVPVHRLLEAKPYLQNPRGLSLRRGNNHGPDRFHSEIDTCLGEDGAVFLTIESTAGTARAFSNIPATEKDNATFTVRSALQRTQRYLSITRSSEALTESAQFILDMPSMVQTMLAERQAELSAPQRARFEELFRLYAAKIFIKDAEDTTAKPLTFLTESGKDGTVVVRVRRDAANGIEDYSWIHFTMKPFGGNWRNRYATEWRAIDMTSPTWKSGGNSEPVGLAEYRKQFAAIEQEKGFDGLLAKMREEAETDSEAIARLAKVEEQLQAADTQASVFEVTQEDGKPKPWEPSGSKPRVSTVTLLEKGHQRFLEFTAPADMAGTKMLQLSPDRIYVFLPAFGKVRRIVQDKDNPFQPLVIADFQTRFYDRFEPALTRLEKTRYVLRLKRRQPGTSPYGTIEIDADPTRNLPMELRYFDDAGALIKTETRSNYQCQAKVCAATDLRFQRSSGEVTVLKRASWKVNAGIADDVFSLARFGKLNQTK